MVAINWQNIPIKKIRETVLSYVAGILFAMGWWWWIDATSWSNCCASNIDNKVTWWHWFPNVIQTICLLSINAVSWTRKEENLFNLGGEKQSIWAAVWLLISLVTAILMLLAAIIIAVIVFFVPGNGDSIYCGVALIITDGFIFSSIFVYRLAVALERSEEDLGGL